MESILNFFSEYLSRGDFMELFAANKNMNIFIGLSLFTFCIKLLQNMGYNFLPKKFTKFFFFFLWQRQISGPLLFHKVSANVNPVFYSWKDNIICLTYAYITIGKLSLFLKIPAVLLKDESHHPLQTP